ncbi:MAG TPA: HEAT repeat domain-containing protein, partial [Gemmataceae bacterium]|nr:HEAT repeat domain-containing protein [Gemmataceae bacterium]
ALAERLTRMKAEVLSRYFQDGDGEIRRAAALASAMKGAKSLIPDLIPLLSDADAAVSHAAHAALRDLSGEQLGATEAEWKAWWKNRDK